MEMEWSIDRSIPTPTTTEKAEVLMSFVAQMSPTQLLSGVLQMEVILAVRILGYGLPTMQMVRLNQYKSLVHI